MALLLIAVSALCTFAANRLFKSPIPKVQSGLERGKPLAQIPTIDYQSNKRTLLIVLNTNCKYCSESAPLYRKLMDQNSQSSKLHIVAIFPNRADEVSQFMKTHELKMEAVTDIQLDTLRLSGTPSLILVNSAGEINDFWVGKLTESEAEHVLLSLASETVY